MNAVRRAARFARALGVVALMLAAPAAAAPPAGTVIPNEATASAVIGVTPVSASSNVVQLTTSARAIGSAATLVASAIRRIAPGGTAYFSHMLTNGAAAADTFALSVANLAGTFDFASFAIFPDANGDGVPDSAVPVPATVTLAPGGVFRFVVSATVPAGAANFTTIACRSTRRARRPAARRSPTSTPSRSTSTRRSRHRTW